MVEYRSGRDPIRSDKLKNGAVIPIAIIGMFFSLLFALLFASGFWSAKATQPLALPLARASAATGQQPGVVVASDEVAVGTMRSPVDVPTVREKQR